MPTRSIIVRLEAEVAGYVAGMGRAGVATDNVARQVVQARRSIDDNAKSMDTAGKSMVAFGALTLGALGASAKAAMDWETAWAGVTKTINGTPAELDALQVSLRDMAKNLPASHEEIAAVAESAGQLGVATKDIAGFTKTMIDLGVSTNLTAEEAGTAIAQISNVMGTMAREGSMGAARFGATLVALGNNGASTEKEILSMAQRISGAAATVGATETDVLALSNTLASMGIQAELGGGVTTRVLLKMFSAVKDGGPKLDAFARTAGTSAKAFADAYSKSPMLALDMVDKGLHRIKEQGGNVVQAMKDMGIKGTQETQVMLALANSGDLLTDSLKLGSKAWQDNTALLNEANKRYDTTASKVKIAWNNITDAAITAGSVLLPMLQTVASSVSGLATGFASLPGGVQSGIVVLTGVVGVAALAGGSLLTLVPKIADTRAAFAALNNAGSSIPGMFSNVAKGAGVALAGIVAFEGIKDLYNSMQPATQGVESFSQGLLGLGKQGHALDDVFKHIDFGQGDKFAGQINTAGDALNKMINQDFDSATASFGASVFKIDNGYSKIADAVKKSDQAIAAAASSGQTELAAKGFKAVADSAAEHGIKLDQVAAKYPQYIAALKDMATQAGVSVPEPELLNWALGQLPPTMQAAADGGNKAAAGIVAAGGAAADATPEAKAVADALDKIGVSATGVATDMVKFTDALLAAGLLNLSARDAARQYQAAIDAVGQSIAQNGTSLDINTAQGRANQAALDGIASAGYNVIKSNAANGASQASLQGNLTDTYNKLVAGAGQFGITGGAAQNLARDILHVPKGVSITSWMSSEAKRMAQETTGALTAIPKQVTVHVDTINTRWDKVVGVPSATSVAPDVADGSRGQGLGVLLPKKKADGGAVSGPGTGTSDTAGLYALSDGEHVFDKGDVLKMGGQQAVYKFRENLRASQFTGMAEGGAVGRMGTMHSVATSRGLSIDYGRLAAAVGGGGTSVSIVAPDKATAAEYFDEAQYQSRVMKRGGVR